ncbi:MAG: metallophosphoesterase family protein [Bryobacteraceae bacterium]
MKNAFLFIITIAALLGQTATALQGQSNAASLPTTGLLSEPGPTFRINDNQLAIPLTFITYGDMRFTDPENTTGTNPKVRRWLVNRIAEESPGAVVLNGDVPLAGNVKNDYIVFKSETQPWRDSHLRVFPALGNHEFHGDPRECLQNWWQAFPELRNRRWYSVQLGSRVYVIALDSDASLMPESDQTRWLKEQLSSLPKAVDFVVFSMHHPPVADIQTHIEVNHNPRPNEIALRDYLSAIAPQLHARFIVSAGHIHNYERQIKDDVVYLVSGGGGAKPYIVERTPEDLYKSILYPNYHYVKFTLDTDRLHAVMVRVSDPEASTPAYAVKDSFDVIMKSARVTSR